MNYYCYYYYYYTRITKICDCHAVFLISNSFYPQFQLITDWYFEVTPVIAIQSSNCRRKLLELWWGLEIECLAENISGS
jgi:hypothetical protein